MFTQKRNTFSRHSYKKRKFPFCQQLEGMDCGPACLRMVAQSYGRKHSLQYLRELSNISRRGVNLLGIGDAAESIGFRTLGVRITFEKLRDNAQLPCIIHWRQVHFAVVYGIETPKLFPWINRKQTLVYVADPAHGLLSYTEEEFKKNWISTRHGGEEKGIAMLLEPSPYFYEAETKMTQPLTLNFLFNYLKPYKKLIWQLFWGILVGSLLQLVFPFLTQAIVDQGIGHRNIAFIYVVLFAQLALVAGSASIDFIRRWILLHISTRINISLISDFLTKLMKLSMKYFDTKLTGDLIQRINDHSRIEEFLTQSVLSITIGIINLVVFGIVLAIYNLKIFVIFLIGSLIYIFWIRRFLKKRKALDHKSFAQMSIHQGNLIQIVQGMQEIKLTGSERQKRWEWESIQAEIFKIKMNTLSLGQWQQGGAIIINEVKNVFITFVSANAVLSGNLTLGAMLSMQFIIGQLHGPISQMVSFMQQAQNANLSLERMGEIHGREDEEPGMCEPIPEIESQSGINISQVCFQYNGPHSHKVLENLSLFVPAGKTTAIVGSSGSGKTTLLKLLLGFYPPVSGDIQIGNISLSQVSFKEWRRYCGVVMQDGYIFNDTIANNIAPGEDEIDKKRLSYAVSVANIGSFIELLPLKFNTKIGNEGNGLSQGQKQRILIARTVYKNPQFIFFDEATNALDANNEKIIMKNLNAFFNGRTVIIVAHRLSTVKNADQIVVLHQGKIVEIGKHEELVLKRGAYYTLVSNQLELGN
ncbi:MAG: peptidase domain-containing ABC transporter [Dysgonamonadaceae bacterium]|jgi:ATP-binding cassette subfamily B protein|nr:peptidase domain-containing ABC transporter [Dysgonamonadaceae bacterium]